MGITAVFRFYDCQKRDRIIGGGKSQMWEDFHWPFLDNPPFPWYPYTRCKAHKNQGLTGFPAVTAVKCAECSRPSTRKTKLKEKNK